MRPLLSIVCVFFLLAGCGLNSVDKLTPESRVNPGRAVLVYGVGMVGKWDAPMFSVTLDEYSIKDQNATGNCNVFNRADALISSTPGPVQYFAFEVPPGHYVY